MHLREFLLGLMVAILSLAGCSFPSQPVDLEKLGTPGVPWVKDEIIIFGTEEDIESLLAAVKIQFKLVSFQELKPKVDITPMFNTLRQRGELERFFQDVLGANPPRVQTPKNFFMQTYHFEETTVNVRGLEIKLNVELILEFVRQFRESKNSIPERFVFAEPNYWISSLESGPECPGITSEPNTWGNGPYGLGVESSGKLPEFQKQWAFQLLAGQASKSEDSDPLRGQVSTRKRAPTDKPVDVVIFDSSPYTIPKAFEMSEERFNQAGLDTAGTEETVVLTKTQTMTLNVWHWKLDQESNPTVQTSKGYTDVDEHGIFIAGLIHKIAPESNLKLVRVLDKFGCGTSSTLLTAMAYFLLAEKDNSVVFNLSLGIPKSSYNAIGLNKTALLVLMLGASAGKTIVVAAAGNNSAACKSHDTSINTTGCIGGVRPPLYPAAYRDDDQLSGIMKVVAVEASNYDNKPACFSNQGKNPLFAPGGDGLVEDSCSPMLKGCKENATCTQALMSVTHDGKWIFWTGTSFATPLVSGAAAYWLAQGCSVEQVLDHLFKDYGSNKHFNLTSFSCR